MHISKFLQLRKQMHLFCSVENFMGACMGLCTPGILCQSGSQSEQTHTHAHTHIASMEPIAGPCRASPIPPNPLPSWTAIAWISLSQCLPALCLSLFLTVVDSLCFSVFITLSLCNKTTLKFINTPMTRFKKKKKRGKPGSQNEHFFFFSKSSMPLLHIFHPGASF